MTDLLGPELDNLSLSPNSGLVLKEDFQRNHAKPTTFWQCGRSQQTEFITSSVMAVLLPPFLHGHLSNERCNHSQMSQ